MSFVKKAVKKVFKFVKRLVKNKVFQVIAVVALSVFTAGVAAGGFAAFSGVNSVGAFFTAVGQTMATGAASIASSLGFQGAAQSLAAKGGMAAVKAGLVTTAETAGSIASSAAAAAAKAGAAGNASMAAAHGATAKAAATMAHALPAAGTTAAQAAATGVSGTFSKILGKKVLGNVTTGQLATNMAMTGMKSYMEGKASDKARPNGYVAGDVARGGGSETFDYTITGGGPRGEAPDAEQALASNTQAEIGEQGESLAGQMARSEPEPTGGLAEYAGEPAAQQYAQQDYGEAITGGESLDGYSGGQMQTEQAGPAGLVPDSPFQDRATRIQYDPRRQGLVGAV